MAGKCEAAVGNEFKGILIHGPTKYEINLRNTSESTIQDLSEEAFNLTKVPTSRQRLICKGKSLTKFENTLQEYGLINGSKILLIGKKNDPEEEKLITSIAKIEKKVDEDEQEIKKMESDFESLKQGFLDSKQIEESFKRLEKRLDSSEEDLMKTIETLDCLELENSFQEAKLKKKKLIQRIQRLHDEVDKLHESKKEYCEDKYSQKCAKY